MVQRFSPGESRSRRVDYIIWCTEDGSGARATRCEVVDWEVSDHRGLRAELEIATTADEGAGTLRHEA
jgi:hypothetical protein